MHSALLISALSGLAAVSAQTVTGKLGDAQVVADNPMGVTYTATLPNSNKTAVRGSISAQAAKDGIVAFHLSLTGLPATGGPFLYHLHDQPVPADGNCTSTLAHLDPTERGEDPPCDKSQPQTCQVGDLSGKNSPATTPAFDLSFTDKYASIKPGLGAFFGNRSIVVHFANKTRITCANFVKTQGTNSSSSSSNSSSSGTGSGSSTGSSTGSGTGSSSSSNTTAGTSSTPIPYVSAATTTVASLTVLAAGFAAVFFL